MQDNPGPLQSTSMEGQIFCPLPRRFAAMLYDSLLLAAILMLAAAAVVIPTGAQVDPGHFAFQLYLLVVAWAYFAICWRGGQTLGMKAWRIRLVTPTGQITWLETATRFFVTCLSLISFGLG
ncbi:MAG: RDD family protein, partial [Wenzhouxiangella sp.]